MKFDILFDRGEPSRIDHPAYEPYGNLGFPEAEPGAGRPWIYSNFVQSLDGIVSLRGKNASGGDISKSPQDRWLMDLLRAHAGAVMLGVGTLVSEREMSGGRGPVFRIMDEQCRQLRQSLGGGREVNVFVTGGGREIDMKLYRAFDGELVDVVVLTTSSGAERLKKAGAADHVKIVVAGESTLVDLPLGMRKLRSELGIERLLCEGGPRLYGEMARAGLIDEKFVTVSPVEVGLLVPPEQEMSDSEKANPPKYRLTTFDAPGFLAHDAPWWEWVSCRRIGDHQFSRYRRIAANRGTQPSK